LGAKYTNFPTSRVTAPGAPPTNAKGHYLNRAPKDTLSAGVEYAIDAGSTVIPIIRPRAEVYYSDKAYMIRTIFVK
jgi:hypothetical protein